MASSSPGADNFYGLEAALERAVFFNGLAIFAGRGCADALNFTAAERGLQNIRGVERAFGRTCANQSVELVNEDDGVLVLHQFLHDGLEALFKLSAVFCAGDDEGKIERKNALVGEERRDVAIGDALRETFDDGGLADSGLANEHGIILRAAAENLNDALEFAFAADERIELAIGGGLREIAAEFREQRGFLWAIHGNFFAGATGEFFAQS